MFSLCQSENSNKSEAIVLIVVHATLPVPPMTSLCNPIVISVTNVTTFLTRGPINQVLNSGLRCDRDI